MKSEEDKKSTKSLKSFNIDLKTSFTISPMTKWILTILILGVGVVLVVVLYAQEQSRNSDLKDEVDRASTTLIENSLRRKAAENRLIAANLGVAVLSAQFPSAKQTMDVEEELFNAAADSGVVITMINCPEPKSVQYSGASYQAYSASLTVEGDTENCLTLVGRLGFWLPTASIESVSFTEGGMSLRLQVYAGVGNN